MERNELIVADLTNKLNTQDGGGASHAKKAVLVFLAKPIPSIGILSWCLQVKPDELVQMYGRLIQDVEDLEALDESPEGSEPRKALS